MNRFPVYFMMLLFLFFYFNCQVDKSPEKYANDISSSELGIREIFTFSADSAFPIGSPIPLEMDPTTKIVDVSDTIGNYLSSTYF